jgi:2-polyprenyl-3-methyl-5-hydroxy-6-metoxy-1,4-benzoquinol methylase
MEKRIKLILDHLNSSDKVLDIGCVNHKAECSKKDTWLHKHIRQKCKNVKGMDIEKEEVEKLNQLGFDVIWGDCEDFDLGEKYDVVIAGELVEHLSNPGRFLSNVRMHLRPEGRFILSVPNAYCYYNILSVIFRGRVPVNDQHVCWYDKRTLRSLLERHGFRITAFEYMPIPATGRGSTMSYVLSLMGLSELSACGFFVVCKMN